MPQFQPGQSGNPKGRTPGSLTRPQLRAFVTAEQMREFADWVMANYKSDVGLAKWLGDQLFGRAMISIMAGDPTAFEGDAETRRKIAAARAQILGKATAVEVMSEIEAEERMAENAP